MFYFIFAYLIYNMCYWPMWKINSREYKKLIQYIMHYSVSFCVFQIYSPTFDSFWNNLTFKIFLYFSKTQEYHTLFLIQCCKTCILSEKITASFTQYKFSIGRYTWRPLNIITLKRHFNIIICYNQTKY